VYEDFVLNFTHGVFIWEANDLEGHANSFLQSGGASLARPPFTLCSSTVITALVSVAAFRTAASSTALL
jgi:hypothetical protein